MDYEYNGHLTEEERVKQVSKEIKRKYQRINDNDLKWIASLEAAISTSKTKEMEFNRLFNILFVMQDDKIIFEEVFSDLKKIYLEYQNDLSYTENTRIDRMMEEVLKFYLKQREYFPIISEFYI